MLQQTQVSRVIDKYREFLERFPTLTHIAESRSSQVVDAWEGLGYYARARNLYKLARELHENEARGRLPDNPEELRRLPGIGAYTAGAVASFAYEKRASLVDTNVARVLKRVFAPDVNPKTTAGNKKIWQIAQEALPKTGKATWVHNQAVMELGALVCTARQMNCDRCPVTKVCATWAVSGKNGKRKNFKKVG
jgi:A/G-specific adenine glycosylase